MWRSKKCLHNCQDFTILHIFHVEESEIPLHFSDFSPFAMNRNLTDFSPHETCGLCDKYEVWLIWATVVIKMTKMTMYAWWQWQWLWCQWFIRLTIMTTMIYMTIMRTMMMIIHSVRGLKQPLSRHDAGVVHQDTHNSNLVLWRWW